MGDKDWKFVYSRKKKNPLTHVVTSYHSIEQGWIYLASEILRLAIKDVRQENNTLLAHEAQSWLLSPVGKNFFEFFLSGSDINIDEWVLAGCPHLDKK